MGELRLEETLTFEGQSYKAVSIAGKRQDGFKPTNLYQNDTKDKIVVVGDSLNVLAVLSSSDVIEVTNA